jgi:SAM-dependent methyltransferase
MVQLRKPQRLRATIVNSDLYDHPALYDELFPVGEHLPYYTDLARKASGDVLELACGTGQIAVPIASAGLPIAGLDLSSVLLGAARERAMAANVSLEFVLGDMRNFDLGRKFALIFIARNSLLHLHSIEDLLAAFTAINRHLAHGGVFAFDIFNPNVRLLGRPAGQRFPVFEKDTASFGKLNVEQTTDYDPATQVGHSNWFVSAVREPDAWKLSLDLRNIFAQELPLLLAAGGFRLEQRAGDLSQSPFNSTSRFQVCVCRAVS